MKLLNRDLQLDLLRKLSDTYPAQLSASDLGFENDDPALLFNIAYLTEHGLVQAKLDGYFSGEKFLVAAGCTARGIDFLADDGGLSAVLGVVTVKIHDDTIKQLVAARIQASDLPEPEKQQMLDQLRELPAEATKHLALQLLDKALEAGPAAIEWLQNILG